jgi:hypothetical protein
MLALDAQILLHHGRMFYVPVVQSFLACWLACILVGLSAAHGVGCRTLAAR